MESHKNTLRGILTVIIIALSSYGTFAQSQTAANIQAGSSYEKADRELNLVYKQILIDYAKQPLFIKKFKIAQRLWVQLRNAELGAKFPETGSYGSAQPMCKSGYLEQLTRERTKFLRVWLTGIQEGDVCSGSVKTK
ncbi:Protein of unknown function [Pedobacter westerhofensis]|uniref:Lysozyme inhibitor LprI-like N-terminal domain-containing protein n=1 Tax=Pedobacter westerhofensis TaxID=425512 RepID=A0A521FSW8_9SPHI|nr:lysozyme inhibitor LprI family protein [Pedobacter westerhofensis]SMO99259.1 Protein of unknown function [Pedobacter westerhofensis]